MFSISNIKTNHMKKLVFFTALLAFGFSTAQQSKKNEKLTLKKDTWYLGGDTSFRDSNDEFLRNDTIRNRNNRYRFNISPRVGCFIQDNLLVGLGVNYVYDKNNNTNMYTNENNELTSEKYWHTDESLGIVSYLRKYIPISKNLALFI